MQVEKLDLRSLGDFLENKINSSQHQEAENHRKEAKVINLTYDCLEQMDALIMQSSRGIHLLFDHLDIVAALKDGESEKDEHDIEKLKEIQAILYKFISFKEIDDKKKFLKTLSRDQYSLLIRAYFKIVDNSILTKVEHKH